ncbi:hypothetical protein [Natrinema salsiterrestre]|uniref:Uncharacterized protein n=1 Tax=Natrinema salsiterrestre TaxID=2950540 RepID=A0A9Q4Q453_9EURY|nr:hypothetical protein [Natrinema salsiterrestre]MDF9748246.1 hypothetical protein [Natrinema salsiterrestre]
MQKKKPEKGVKRRNVLKSIGATSAGVAALPSISSLAEAQVFGNASATPSTIDNTSLRSLVIESSGKVEYEFTVTGLLSANDAPSETISNGTGSATLENETHEFSFTGEFTAFDIAGDATVRVDGEAFDYETFPHNTLVIATGGTVDYDISATGRVEVESETSERPSDRRVTGTVHSTHGWSFHAITYAGELTYLDTGSQTDGSEVVVVKNGTEIDPDRPLPSVKPSRARVESLGSAHDYYLHLGWDVATESGGEVVDRTDYGMAQATATSQTTTYSYSGAFQFVVVPDVGLVKNNPKDDTVACISLADEELSVTIVTSNGSTKELSATSEALNKSEVNVQITNIRMEPEDQQGPEGIEVNLEPNVTAEAAERAKKLHLAAELEREPEFEAVARRAESTSGRIRYDSAGITAFRISRGSNSADPAQRTLFIGAKFDLADVDGEDIVSAKIAKNTSTGEVVEGQIIKRLRTENNVPEGVQVEQLDTKSLGTATTSGSAEFESAAVEYDTDQLSPQSVTQEANTQKVGDLAVNTNGLIDIPDWLIPDQVKEMIDDGVDVAVDIANSGVQVSLSGYGALNDWAYEAGKFQGFSKKGAMALNKALAAPSPFVTALNEFNQQGEVTTCSCCITFGTVALSEGVGTAATMGCTALGGPVGGLTCSVFFNVLSDMLVQHDKVEVALEKTCSEANLC